MSQQHDLEVKKTKNTRYCSWCKVHFAGTPEFHVNERNHKNNLCFTDWKSEKGFVEPFILIQPTRKSCKYMYNCLICDCSMPGNRDHYVRSHIIGKKHSSMVRLCSNIFPLQGQQFYCVSCDYVMISPCHIFSHINEEVHTSLQLKCDNSRSPWRTTWESFVCPFVTKKTDQDFYCMACGVSLSSRNDLTDHVESKNHTSALMCYGSYLTPWKNDYFHCGLCNLVFRHDVNVRAHLTGSAHLNNSELHPINWSAKPNYVAPFVSQAGENNFYCMACDRSISSAVALESHKNRIEHLEIVEWEMDHIAPLENGSFTCKLCRCFIHYEARINKHLTGNSHLEKLGVSVAIRSRIRNEPKIATWSSVKNAVAPFVLVEENDKFYCALCNRYFLGTKALECHTLGRLHKDLLSGQSRFTHLFDNGSFYCSLCDQNISDYYRIDSHLRSTKHSSLWSIVSTKKENTKCEKSDAGSGHKAKDDSKQNQEIQSKSHSAESITSSRLGSPKSKKNCDVKSTNSERKVAQIFENLDESVLNFQKRCHEKSSNFENDSQVNKAAHSTDFRSIVASSEKMQQHETENIGTNTCSRNLGSSGKSNCLADTTEGKTRLLSENTSSIDANGSDNLDQLKTVAELQRDRKNFDPEPKVTDTEEKKNWCGSVDSGIENLSPFTPTSSISLENPVGRKRVQKTYLERVATLLDFQEDIYDTSERMMQVELGLDVLFFTDSTRSYCLACRKIIPFSQEMNNCLVHLCNLEHLQRLDEMKKRHEEMSAIPGSCDELSLALESMEILSNDIAECFVCHEKMENNESLLLQHINDEKHRKSREGMLAKTQAQRTLITSQIPCDWYQVLKYECAACSIKFDLEIEFVEHLLDDEEHANQLKILDDGGANMNYESCALCALIVCSNVQTNHHETLLHKWFLRNGPFIPNELPESTKKLLISLGNNETRERIDLMPEIEKNCRISIVRAYGKGSGHDYDSTFGIEPPVHDLQFIKFFNKICPSTLDMISFLKQWLVECDLFGAEKISTVALYWYVVLYLQAISILPSIATLNSMKKFWRGFGESEHISEMEEKQKFVLRHHVVGFFRLYTNFDYRYDIACPLLGIAIEKRAFTDNLHCLREEMKSYVFYTSNNEFAEPFRVDSVMCLQDPFDLQNNLTKSVSKFDLSRFRIFCSKSLSFLCPSET